MGIGKCINASVLAGILASFSACTGRPSEGTIGEQNFALRSEDGSYSLYTGKDIAELIQKGEIPDANHPGSYYKLRVPEALMQSALNKKGKRVYSLSLEDVQFSDVELTVHTTKRPGPGQAATAEMEDTVVHPGDPWVTGIAQVYIPDAGPSPDPNVAVGLFVLTVYAPSRIWPESPLKGLSNLTYDNGVTEDPDGLPVLNYANLDPRTWPPLPENWK